MSLCYIERKDERLNQVILNLRNVIVTCIFKAFSNCHAPSILNLPSNCLINFYIHYSLFLHSDVRWMRYTAKHYIDENFIVDFVNDNYEYILKSDLSFFEISFAISLCYFRLKMWTSLGAARRKRNRPAFSLAKRVPFRPAGRPFRKKTLHPDGEGP